jgi:hypothetical protein
MLNSYDINFDAPDAHFDIPCLFRYTKAKKFGTRNATTVTPPPKRKESIPKCREAKPNPWPGRIIH